MKYSSLFLLLLCITSFSVIAQKSGKELDSLMLEDVINHEFKIPENDKTTFLIERFHQFENIGDGLNLGNNGTVSPNLIFESQMKPGFESIYDNRFYGDKRNYDTKFPFTSVQYVLGAKNEQYFKLFHTQNINSNWNIAFDYDKVKSEGFFINQKTNNDLISASTYYKGKNNHYHLFGNYYYNTIRNTENGGIADDSDSLLLEFVNTSIVPVNLDNALTKNKTQLFSIDQHYYIGGVPKRNDSMAYNIDLSALRVRYNFELRNNHHSFTNTTPDTAWYDNFYYDSTITHDNFKTLDLSNSIFVQGLSKTINYTFGSTYDMINYSQFDLDTNYENLSAIIALYNDNQKGLDWNAKVEYFVDGYNKNDINSSLGIVYYSEESSRKLSNKISLDIDYSMKQPIIEHVYYRSNHFRWNNDFEKIEALKGLFSIDFPNIETKLSVEYSIIGNYIYFDTTAIAKQESNQSNVLKIKLEKNITFKALHIDNQIYYQNTFNSDIIRLPEFYSKNSIYLEGYMFKKALYAQFGIDMLYFSSYYGSSFSPATGQFYLQNKMLLGDYPYFDVFFNAKLDRARIFLKAGHVNGGFMGDNYFVAPNYPIPFLALKFGINWQFFN